MEANPIPNIRIENIGSRQHPMQAIRGFIELPCWNGYYLYDDSYKLKNEKFVTKGRIALWVDGEIRPGNSMQFSPAQVDAYVVLVKDQEENRQSIVSALKQEFPRLLSEEYASWDQYDPNFPRLQDLAGSFDFKTFIGPESISIMEDEKDGISYITWQFRCRWDNEHGFQVLTHKNRVIEIGPEIDIWNIYKDNGSYEQELKAYNERAQTPGPKKKRKWWQFW